MAESVAIVIPARYASTRLYSKPLLDISGKPMIQWVYENSKQVDRASRIIVATDSQKIIDAVGKFGGEAMMTKENHPSGTDRVAEVAESIEESIIVNVQGDEPFISPDIINKAIDTVWEKPEINMGSLMKPISSSEELNDTSEVRVVTDKESNALYFTRAIIPFVRGYPTDKWLGASIPFFNHVGIYVYRRKFLLKLVTFPPSPLEKIEHLEQLRVLENGFKIRMNIVNETGISVDTEEDLEKARKYANTIL